MSSPTQRSKKHLESIGYKVWITEKWIPFANIRQDLFNMVDMVAIREGETLGVQTTSAPNIASRVAKILENEYLEYLAKAGWSITVHGWRKPTKTKRVWSLRVVDLVVKGTIVNKGESDACRGRESEPEQEG